jgi:predicted membrane-bound mannosyltransferase
VVALAGQIGVLMAAVVVLVGVPAGFTVGAALALVAWLFRRGLSDPAPRVRVPDSPAALNQPYYSG